MNTQVLELRDWQRSDYVACLTLFDANCPEFFASNEREDYAQFLEAGPAGYRACVIDGRVVGAFGVELMSESTAGLHWILLAPDVKGRGLGTTLMSHALQASRAGGCSLLRISASHRSASFFAKFGAAELSRVPHGWGPGMHRVEMQIELR